MDRSLRTAAGAAAIAIAVFLLYLPALRGGFLWDDDVYVTKNFALRSAGGLVDIWKIPPTTRQYYPVTFTVAWAEYQLWGNAPLGHHAVNVLLHAANALLVWRILLCLGVPGAWLAAWLFAIHPVQVEAVAWVTQLRGVLSAFFALLSTLAFARYLDDGRRSRLLSTVLCCVLALLSKTQVCGLPIALLLLAWWKRPARIRPALPALMAMTAAAALVSLVTVWMEQPRVEVLVPMPQLDAWERALVAGRALWFYATNLLWPFDQRAIYGHWAIDSADPSQALFPLSAAGVLAALWMLRRRIGRGPFTGVAIFALAVAPAIGIIDFGFLLFSFVADHFEYLASVPLIALAIAAGASLAPRPLGATLGVVVPAGLVLFSIMLAGVSVERASTYADAERLWRQDIACDPHNAAAYNRLGNTLYNRGRYDEAVEAFRRAVEIDPNLADAQHNWARALQQQRKFDEALEQYRAALRLRPDSRAIRNSMGVALQLKGDPDGALRIYEEALRLDPSFANAHNNIGTILLARGDVAAAIEQFEAALALQPAYSEAEDNLGYALKSAGRLQEAIPHFERAVRLDPDAPAPRRHLENARAE